MLGIKMHTYQTEGTASCVFQVAGCSFLSLHFRNKKEKKFKSWRIGPQNLKHCFTFSHPLPCLDLNQVLIVWLCVELLH